MADYKVSCIFMQSSGSQQLTFVKMGNLYLPRLTQDVTMRVADVYIICTYQINLMRGEIEILKIKKFSKGKKKKKRPPPTKNKQTKSMHRKCSIVWETVGYHQRSLMLKAK